MPQLQGPAVDQLQKIEAMLEQGMSEDQILAALTGAPPAPAAPVDPFGSALSKATGISAALPRMSSPLRFIREMVFGVKDPLDMEPGELQGTLPLPFTDLRLNPADAAMGLGGSIAGGTGVAKLPGFIQSLLDAPANRARAVNQFLNDLVPSRLTDPGRLLPPFGSSGDATHIIRNPPVPSGMLDDIPVQTPDLPPGFTDFINTEAFPETAAMGTMPPVRFTPGTDKVRRAATQRAVKGKGKK